jgi:hypothetical protein
MFNVLPRLMVLELVLRDLNGEDGSLGLHGRFCCSGLHDTVLEPTSATTALTRYSAIHPKRIDLNQRPADLVKTVASCHRRRRGWNYGSPVATQCAQAAPRTDFRYKRAPVRCLSIFTNISHRRKSGQR